MGLGVWESANLRFGVSLRRVAMSWGSGPLCRVPASNVRCGLRFSELATWRSRGWEMGLRQESVSLNSHRFLVDNGYGIDFSFICIL